MIDYKTPNTILIFKAFEFTFSNFQLLSALHLIDKNTTSPAELSASQLFDIMKKIDSINTEDNKSVALRSTYIRKAVDLLKSNLDSTLKDMPRSRNSSLMLTKNLNPSAKLSLFTNEVFFQEIKDGAQTTVRIYSPEDSFSVDALKPVEVQ